MTRIIVVDDDDSIIELLSIWLADEGFEPLPASRGEDALVLFESVGADLVLLDLNLPGLPGIETFRRLRSDSSVPVIMVTGKDSEVDRIVGLEIGADDYVTKPFSPRELMARVRAVLRRQSAPVATGNGETLRAGPVRMDTSRHEVTVRGVPVKLPLKEYRLLEVLLRNAGLVLTRARLIETIWGADYVGDTKTLDVHIKRLRARIEPTRGQQRHIVTLRGLGYKFEKGEGNMRVLGELRMARFAGASCTAKARTAACSSTPVPGRQDPTRRPRRRRDRTLLRHHRHSGRDTRPHHRIPR